MGAQTIRFPASSAIGIKPVSEEGTKRLIRAAHRVRDRPEAPSVTLVHKGNIMKFTEGGFRDWGYELAPRGVRRRSRSTAAPGAGCRRAS